jgi:hypothetical protein
MAVGPHRISVLGVGREIIDDAEDRCLLEDKRAA